MRTIYARPKWQTIIGKNFQRVFYCHKINYFLMKQSALRDLARSERVIFSELITMLNGIEIEDQFRRQM
jgi:hypothetical protein